jgi:hypothetical protein
MRKALLCISFSLMGLTMCFAAPRYPIYVGERSEPAEGSEFEGQIIGLYPELKDYAKKPSPVLTEKDHLSRLQKAAQHIAQRTWPVVSADGKMSLPGILIAGRGLNCGGDEVFNIHLVSQDSVEQIHVFVYGMYFGAFFHKYPKTAFEYMANLALNPDVTTLDVLHLSASIGSFPSFRTWDQGPKKSDWDKLYTSPNSCYRLIALNYLSAVPHSPSEQIALYRECLFGSCSFLENRAIFGIRLTEDSRAEVAQLLEDYAASNPLIDDNSGPTLRNAVPHLRDGALKQARLIREKIATSGEQGPNGWGTASPEDSIPTAAKKPLAPAALPAPLPDQQRFLAAWWLLVIILLLLGGRLWKNLQKPGD